jgi:hypothetical protein
MFDRGTCSRACAVVIRIGVCNDCEANLRYMHLSMLPDGIGEAILDFRLAEDIAASNPIDLDAVRREAIDLSSGPEGENFRHYVVWSEVYLDDIKNTCGGMAEFPAQLRPDIRCHSGSGASISSSVTGQNCGTGSGGMPSIVSGMARNAWR